MDFGIGILNRLYDRTRSEREAFYIYLRNEARVYRAQIDSIQTSVLEMQELFGDYIVQQERFLAILHRSVNSSELQSADGNTLEICPLLSGILSVMNLLELETAATPTQVIVSSEGLMYINGKKGIPICY